MMNTDLPWQPLISTLYGVKDPPIPGSASLDAIRAEFDALWKGVPIDRTGDTVGTHETTLLRQAMKAIGLKWAYRNVSEPEYGFIMSYGNAAEFFCPLFDKQAAMIGEYKAAIAALKGSTK